MKVILLEKIRNFGDLGDTVQVKAGYARNFLIPKGKAVPATKENIAEFEARRAALEKTAAEQLAIAQKRASTLEGTMLTIVAKAHENKLFGSVGPREIVNALAEKGLTIEKREINMPEGALHEVGEYQVELSLHSDVNVTITVIVQAEE